jgi:hypothetical protein
MLDFMFVTIMFVTLFAVIVFAIAGAMSWKWQSKTARLLEKTDRNRSVDLLRKLSTGGGWRPILSGVAIAPLTSTALGRCAGSKRSSASSAISLIGCGTQRTGPSSTKSWQNAATGSEVAVVAAQRVC